VDKLTNRELILFKRAAEDAIHACNRHYAPFIDVVAHPLNIISLVEMAQSRQAELDEKDKRIEMCKALFMNYYNGGSDTDDLLDDLEKALRGDDDINVTR
jgi:O-phosphoseryl-tRNA(Cys) synthetase